VFRQRGLTAALFDDAMADTGPLAEVIAKYADQKMLAAIAAEYNKGRLLMIGTTDLDAQRPVIWNIGAIASSSDPRARDLIIEVLRASASIPGVFPPVMLDVTVDGKRYEEMHVDGGAVAQAFLYPPSISLRTIAAKRGVKRRNVAYIIRNGRLYRPEETVQRETLAIAGQALSTMIASSGVNDTFRIYLTAKRDGVDFNLAYIADDFTLPYKGPFDQEYMRALFKHGQEKAASGFDWHKRPPGYVD